MTAVHLPLRHLLTALSVNLMMLGLVGGPLNATAAPTTAAITPPNAVAAEPAARFDLAVNQAPATQVFLQIGANSPYNVLVSPEVSGTVSITLKNATVLEAMEAMRELFGYDYVVRGRRIFVQPNTVQTRLFHVNYLPGRRLGASDIRVTSSSISQAGTPSSSSSGNASTGSLPSSGNNGGGGGGGGSRADDTAHVRTTSDADFWQEVNASLSALVGNDNNRSVVLNPAAGVIVVRATPNELRQVAAYLKAIQLSIERQVMLEAKIVDVELNNETQAGVNWSGFGRIDRGQATIGIGQPGATLGTSGTLSDGTNSVNAGANLATGALGKGFYGFAFQATNFASLLNFLQSQGNARVLSSPRIATLNNQKAILKVGSDELYVTGVTTTTTATGTSSVSSPSVTLQPFFSGIALDVTPQIDPQGNVMLHVHPSISTVSEKQKNVDLGELGNFRLPLAASTINETDSIVRLRDGQIAAIGGLMLQEQRDGRTGVPVLSEAPLIGGLFRQKATSLRKRELVILIKPTVIRSDGSWPEAAALDAETAPAPSAPSAPSASATPPSAQANLAPEALDPAR